MTAHLHERAATNGDQEGNNQSGHSTAKRGLRNQQPVIGRFRDRLRQSLDRIGLDARARRVCARHAFGPLGKLFSLGPEEPQVAPESQRFESSFGDLSRVNDSLMQKNLVHAESLLLNARTNTRKVSPKGERAAGLSDSA